MVHYRAVFALGVVFATACTQFPELDSALSPGAESATYPDLVPIEQLTARVPEPRATEAVREEVGGRIAALKSRAAGLRGPVIDAATLARMKAGVRAPTT